MARRTQHDGGSALARLGRPMPDGDLADPLAPTRFEPAPELAEWIRTTFLARDGALHNPDHLHLLSADLGVLWTNVPARRQMRTIVATAEMPEPRGSAWARARQEFQLERWFGRVPDFLLTFSGPHAVELDDASWCALVEHELYHCAQAENRFGVPRFRRDGRPVFAIRGHDAEEFVGVVARYGASAAAGGVAALVAAANRGPTVAPARIAAACGTCLARVA